MQILHRKRTHALALIALGAALGAAFGAAPAGAEVLEQHTLRREERADPALVAERQELAPEHEAVESAQDVGHPGDSSAVKSRAAVAL